MQKLVSIVAASVMLTTSAFAGQPLSEDAQVRADQAISACVDYMETGKSVKSLKQLGFRGFFGDVIVFADNPATIGRTEIGVRTRPGTCGISISAWRRNSSDDAFAMAGEALAERGFERKSRKLDDRRSEYFFEKNGQKVRLQFVSNGSGSSGLVFNRLKK